MNQWQERKRPVCLECRFEFDSYDATRDFLDKLGDHSEATQRSVSYTHLPLPTIYSV